MISNRITRRRCRGYRSFSTFLINKNIIFLITFFRLKGDIFLFPSESEILKVFFSVLFMIFFLMKQNFIIHFFYFSEMIFFYFFLLRKFFPFFSEKIDNFCANPYQLTHSRDLWSNQARVSGWRLQLNVSSAAAAHRSVGSVNRPQQLSSATALTIACTC